MVIITVSGGEGKNTLSAVFAENRTAWDSYFCDIVTDPLGFPMQLSVSLYLLLVLRRWFDSNVHVTGFATTSIVRPRS